MRGQSPFRFTVNVVCFCLLAFTSLVYTAGEVIAQVKVDSSSSIDFGAVTPSAKNATEHDAAENDAKEATDTIDQAASKHYHIVQRNNDSRRFGLGNLIGLEVIDPVLQSIPKNAACQWSFNKEIRQLGIHYDESDDCELTLQYPYEPQPVSANFTYQVQVIVTSQAGLASLPITQTLSFKNHLYASLAVNSATLSKTKPIVFHVLPKNQQNPFPSEISCLTNLIEKPFEVKTTSENGCSGEVVLTPENRLTSVAKKSLQRASHRVGIIIKYNGLNIGRQVINFSIDT